MFHSARRRPMPAMSSPCQMSRRLLDSSKKALVWTGRPVFTGRGKKQKAWPAGIKKIKIFTVNASADHWQYRQA